MAANYKKCIDIKFKKYLYNKQPDKPNLSSIYLVDEKLELVRTHTFLEVTIRFRRKMERKAIKDDIKERLLRWLTHIMRMNADLMTKLTFKGRKYEGQGKK